METTLTNAPEFFTENDFINFRKMAGEKKENDNLQHQDLYHYLSRTYLKTEYWANEVLKRTFPEGWMKVIKKPTNMAGNFAYYHWARIYPDKPSMASGSLAFTVEINSDHGFIFKLDTINQFTTDAQQKKYESIRGDFMNSRFVHIVSEKEILQHGWEHLINLTSITFTNLKNDFDEIFASFQELEVQEDQTIIVQSAPITHALNTILYGPPGTGKTYHTIDKAVSIANPGFLGTREQIKAEFERLQREGQIEFVTFHQSLSYEDFIEGIKPKVVSDKLVYEIEDGIFKKMCDKARFIAGNFEDVIEKFKKDISQQDGMKPVEIKGTYSNFDIIFRGTGVFYVQPHDTIKEKPWYPVNINNIRKAFLTDDYTGLYNPTYIRGTINHLIQHYGLKKGNESNTGKKNYVLIIDEINRGNVSQIFGELITLIEDSKRFEEKESLTITLPYSKTEFSVPNNLYLIGTMNTADRSVEALDNALRRRFSFEEMLPDTSLIQASPRELDLAAMLLTINNRLEALLSKDHVIGHAWLMGITDLHELQTAFKNKILPLLQEYFFHDYAKIGLVLGDAFVQSATINSGLFARFKDGDEIAGDYTGKIIYTLKDPMQIDWEGFRSIL